MAELKLNEYQIDFAHERQRICFNKLDGASSALRFIKPFVIAFKRKITTIREEYRDMFDILKTFSICEYSQGCTKKYILKFEERDICSNEEYKYCVKRYSDKLYEAGLNSKQYDFVREDVKYFLEALEAATKLEESEKYCDTETILCYTKEKGFYFGAATKLEENKEE